MRSVLIALLAIHGAIHLLGFAKAFDLGAVPQLERPISRAMGLLWLLAGLALTAGAVAVARAPQYWWLIAAPALVLSQVLIVSAWSDAKIGTIANVLILVPLTLVFLDQRSSSFRSIYEREAERVLARDGATAPVTEVDLAKLPPPVQLYLRRVGAVGRPRVHDFRARWAGQMKRSLDSGWMTMQAEQVESFDPATRLFLMDASRFGVPFQALHRYEGATARMQVRLASALDLVDARGPEMDQSETVTLFNDMCLLAPSTLVDADVTWQGAGPRAVRATFTSAGHTVSADLSFDAEGDLVDFVSNDRYLSADGKTYTKLPWSTPVRDYRDFGGRRVPTHADVTWKRPEGDFVYGRFDLVDIEYDATPRRRSAFRVAANAPLPSP